MGELYWVAHTRRKLPKPAGTTHNGPNVHVYDRGGAS